MSEVEPPPEEPDTEPGETLGEDSTPLERTLDASDHAGRAAREDERRERRGGGPSGDEA